MTSVLAVLTHLVEHVDPGVVQPYVAGVGEHGAQHSVGDGHQHVGHVPPVAVERANGDLPAQEGQLVALPLDGQAIIALALDQLREQGRADPSLER